MVGALLDVASGRQGFIISISLFHKDMEHRAIERRDGSSVSVRYCNFPHNNFPLLKPGLLVAETRLLVPFS